MKFKVIRIIVYEGIVGVIWSFYGECGFDFKGSYLVNIF